MRLADALEWHPDRDALFVELGNLDLLYQQDAERIAQAVRAHGLAEDAEERIVLREHIALQGAEIEQLKAVLLASVVDDGSASPQTLTRLA